MRRVYLDWNATAPLRPEAREAMAGAMDVAGNPSSVHAEGRAAKALLERCRAEVAEAAGAGAADVVFTSGATEAAALACAGRGLMGAGVEHDCVAAWTDGKLPVDPDGRVAVADPAGSALQAANSETGVRQDLPKGIAVTDAVQAFGKVPWGFDWSGAGMALLSAHKVGGPKGAGALVLRRGLGVTPAMRGGGQEESRRAGTENLIGIAGFAAAARASQEELARGAWERVTELRNVLELLLEDGPGPTISVGKGAARLPNTLCMIAPGWRGETQVMAMDLAGFAISAGSACSSGKVRESRVLTAMGLGEHAACAIRASLGPATTEREIRAFADAWRGAYAKRLKRAA
ncbi:cysteine desulfurase [Hasllibacter halocynthiae]|uniref:Cysteine desulfurase n=1 Tax=Hasllibacter halocynthiae TaxID=595589 RepID=A0A2T0X8I3_9RHOB|nr:aminotransferase class V-fold PLP-dependent enzyme [Hasllibacter halocynthiae]PRY95250.1 cysteine desulfurase [Hasllibacter halocynthiae]